MKNLENYGVVSLDAREMKDVDGGIIPVIVVAGTIAFWGLAFYGAFMAGYDAAQN